MTSCGESAFHDVAQGCSKRARETGVWVKDSFGVIARGWETGRRDRVNDQSDPNK